MKLRKDRLTERRSQAVERITATVQKYQAQIAILKKAKMDEEQRERRIKALEAKIKTHLTTIVNTNRNLGRS